jgi:hypothetical protein
MENIHQSLWLLWDDYTQTRILIRWSQAGSTMPGVQPKTGDDRATFGLLHD